MQHNRFWLKSTILRVEPHTENRTPVKLQDTYTNRVMHILFSYSEDVKTCNCLFLKALLRKTPSLNCVIEANYIERYVHLRLFLHDPSKSAY